MSNTVFSSKSRFTALRRAFALSTMFVASHVAQAAPVNWINDVSGLWGDASLWSSNPSLPSAADDVSITTVTGVKTITHDSLNDTIRSLTTNASALLVVNGGSSLTITTGGTNGGTWQAGGSSAGTLNLNGGTLATTGSTLLADADGVIALNGVNVVGGELNSSGNGSFLAASTGNNFLRGVTLNGVLDMATTLNSRERVVNGMTVNGEIDINRNGILSFEGDNLLDGNGTVVFGDTGFGNRFDLDGNGTTTIGADITLRGENGTIGQQINLNGIQTLVNNGLISADVNGGTITLKDSAVINNAVLEARSGGTLNLQIGVDNSTGEIRADNSVVIQNGMRVTGGEMNSTGTGKFVVTSSGANFLDAVALTGLLDMSTNLNTRERVINGLTLDGNGTTTIGAGITLRGENGTIGQQINLGGTQTLVNNGLISADVTGGTITLRESAVINNSVIEARNGATLNLLIGVDNSAGEILAEYP